MDQITSLLHILGSHLGMMSNSLILRQHMPVAISTKEPDKQVDETVRKKCHCLFVEILSRK